MATSTNRVEVDSSGGTAAPRVSSTSGGGGSRIFVEAGGGGIFAGGGGVLIQDGGFTRPPVNPLPPIFPPFPAPPAPPPTSVNSTTTATDLQLMIAAIPIAQDDHVIGADFHNALRQALAAIANRLGIGPVEDEVTVTNAPRLNNVTGASPWDHDYGFVKRPNLPGNVRGWMEVELPDGGRIENMTVFGTTNNAGTLKVKLKRQKITDPTVVTDLIVIDIPDGSDPTKGIDGDVTVPGTGAGTVAIEEFRIVNNREQKYLLAVELDGHNSDTTAQFHSAQIVCAR